MLQVRPGHTASVSRQISDEDIEVFARLSLDRNTIHFEDASARRLMYRGKIAHGMIGVALLSGCLTKLTGDGTVWLSSDLKFARPAYPGDTLTATLTVESVDRRGTTTTSATITNQASEVLVSGHLTSIRLFRM